MKTIIKHGETKFRIICPICGCEFEYENEDLLADTLFKKVECPDCKTKILHEQHIKNPNISYEYMSQDYITLSPNDCKICPNRPDPNKIIVGDTPCTWCPKMQPHCISSASTNYTLNSGSYTFQYTNPTVSIKTEKDDDK